MINIINITLTIMAIGALISTALSILWILLYIFIYIHSRISYKRFLKKKNDIRRKRWQERKNDSKNCK